MNGSTVTQIDRLARLQIQDRTATAARYRSRRSLRRAAAQWGRRPADAFGR
jgi:hypothetical protein